MGCFPRKLIGTYEVGPTIEYILLECHVSARHLIILFKNIFLLVFLYTFEMCLERITKKKWKGYNKRKFVVLERTNYVRWSWSK